MNKPIKIVPPADPSLPGVGSYAQDEPELHARNRGGARSSPDMSAAELQSIGFDDDKLAKMYLAAFGDRIVVGDDNRRAIFDAVMAEAVDETKPAR